MPRVVLRNPSVVILGLRLLRQCRRADGMCPYCPNGVERKVSKARHACDRCLEMFRVASRKVIQTRRDAGLCPRCGLVPPQSGMWACRPCRNRAAERNRNARKRAKMLSARHNTPKPRGTK